MTFRTLANPLVRAILRSPAHRLLSNALLLVTYTGGKSGRTYTIPVIYTVMDDALLVYVGGSSKKVWWRNLKTPAQVRLRLRGSSLDGMAQTVRGTEGLRAAYLERFPRAAKSLGADPAPIFVRITVLAAST